jgi:MoaA/NifB/PqqE/SkfB family radical SAM enzyme
MLKFYDQSKVLLYVDKYELNQPVFLEIDPSMECNQSCVWCRYGHSKEKLSYSYMMRKLVDYPCVKGIRITGGGEPLVNPATLKFIKSCYDRGIIVGIETNGSLLDDNAIDIISHCCRYCRVSLDAGSEITYKKLHRSDQFNDVINSIKKFRHNRIRESGISYLVVKSNIEDIKLIPQLGLPIDYVHFKPLIKGLDKGLRDTAVEYIESLKGINARYDRLLQDDSCNHGVSCRISKLVRRIGGDGKEYVCCEHVYEPDFIVGVWNGGNDKCKTCRYNGYNEILESYYANAMCKELL